MAISRFVLIATVTLPPCVMTAIAGNQFGIAGSTEAAGHWGAAGATIPEGTIIYADSGGTGGAGLLYTAIGAGNLRAYADTDAVGHAALAN
jgi:hypothetical protein